MFTRTLRVGTRTSPLALKQIEEVLGDLKQFYPAIGVETVGIDTYGDKDKNTPISDIEGTDFFTREIDDALLRNEVDFCVHSAKDLPDKLRNGLVIAAITKSINPSDALVSKGNLKITQLRRGAKIGTSSLRRKTQLKEYRADFEVVDIRGNIAERLALLETRNLDAIVIAAAGLLRLGLGQWIAQRLKFRPHPLQGSLAIVVREGEQEIIELFSRLDIRKSKNA